jgi:hypothetical protein
MRAASWVRWSLRHGCAPAILTAVELEHFAAWCIDRAPAQDLVLNPCTATTRRPPPWIAALAFDHRAPLEQLASDLNRRDAHH